MGTINEPDTNAGKYRRVGTFAEYLFTLTRADAEDMSHEGGDEFGCWLGEEDLSGFLKSFRFWLIWFNLPRIPERITVS